MSSLIRIMRERSSFIRTTSANYGPKYVLFSLFLSETDEIKSWALLQNRNFTLNLQVTENWSCIEAQMIAAKKIRAQVTLLKTDSRWSTTKPSPCMLVFPAKFFKTCKTILVVLSMWISSGIQCYLKAFFISFIGLQKQRPDLNDNQVMILVSTLHIFMYVMSFHYFHLIDYC